MGLDQYDLSRILETAIVAARLAGQHALEQMRYVKTTVKNETELVTDADRRCQQLIISRIKETFPDDGFIGEEGDAGRIFKSPPRTEPALWWVIDPIDGTNNFAHGIPVFAVSVAALFEGRPVAGVIFSPGTETMYTAVAGGEAQLDGRRIQSTPEEIGPLTSVGLDSHFGNTVPDWVQAIMGQCRFRNFGTTAMQLAYVASGGLAATVACTPKLWDIAAGALIAETAGAVVTNWEGNPLFPLVPEDYDGQPLKTLAANRTAHPKLIEQIAA